MKPAAAYFVGLFLIPLLLWVSVVWDLVVHVRIALGYSSNDVREAWVDQIVGNDLILLAIGILYFLCAIIWVLRPRIPMIAKSLIVAFEVLYTAWVVISWVAEAFG